MGGVLAAGILSALLLFLPARGSIATPVREAAAPPPPRELSAPDAAARARLINAFGQLPLSFEPNVGQADPRVQFLARGRGYNLFLTSDGALLALGGNKNKSNVSQKASRRGDKTQKTKVKYGNSKLQIPDPVIQNPISGIRNGNPESPTFVRLELVGANPAAKAVALEELPGRSNYFIGDDPRKWRAEIPNYAKVKYQDVYPGVDLVYYGNQHELEYDFVVAPGADPKAIRLKFEARDSKLDNPNAKIQNPKLKIEPPLRVEANGDLAIETGAGAVRFRKLVVYQPSAENSRPQTPDRLFVDGSYVLRRRNPKAKIQNPKYEVGFEVAAYEASRPLVIDPVLSYSTYLGGGAGDIGYGIAVDSSGNAYVTGSTGSSDFPTLTPFQNGDRGDADALVSKLNPTGSALVYSTYLGGNGFDRATGIALDTSGNAYVTGYTASTDFPTTSGALQTAAGGNGDAFVSKLNASGSTLAYSTYLGGGDTDSGQGIAVDGSGNAYVTGFTNSANFPTATPMQAANAGAPDAFLSKLNSAGSSLVYSTFLGGSGADSGQAIALDPSANAYVAGYTASTNFPTTAGALQTTAAGNGDAFVAKFNAAGSATVYSTYLGGTGLDRADAIALDSSGNAYVAGSTLSPDFPTLGAFQPQCGGFNAGPPASCPAADAFVSKLNAGGSALVYSSYLGGSDFDQAFGIAVDAASNAYLTGYTRSSNFPTANPAQAAFGGGTCDTSPCSDAFVTELGASGAALVYSTFLGGSGADVGQGIALDSSNNAFVTGATTSTNFPAVAGALQPSAAGSAAAGDAFVVKIAPLDAPAVSLMPLKLPFSDTATNHTSAPLTVALTNLGSAPLVIFQIAVTGDFAETDTCDGGVAAGASSCTITVTFAPTEASSRTGDLTITDNAAGSPHVVSLTGKGVTPASAVTLSQAKLDFGDETVGTTSPVQTVTVTNSGTAVLNISKIAAGGDFAETHDCGSTLNEGASCAVSVTFTPVATGSRTSNLTITDDAKPSPQTVPLGGNGLAVFSLSSDVSSVTLDRAKDSTTFKISAAAPDTFTSSVNLSCSNASPATCQYSPTSIKPGETSTLTVKGFSKVNGDSLRFNSTGTASNQTATLPLTILLTNFSMAILPPLATVTAGDKANYTLTLAPINGFNSAVTLACAGLPRATTCAFTPASPVTLDGTNNSTITVTIQTTKNSLLSPPAQPPYPLPPLVWLASFALLAVLAAAARRKRPARVALLGTMVLFVLLSASCNDYFFTLIQGTAPCKGTCGGAYTIVVTGTAGKLSSNVSVNLGVNP